MPINGGIALSTNRTKKWKCVDSSQQIAQFFFKQIVIWQIVDYKLRQIVSANSDLANCPLANRYAPIFKYLNFAKCIFLIIFFFFN